MGQLEAEESKRGVPSAELTLLQKQLHELRDHKVVLTKEVKGLRDTLDQVKKECAAAKADYMRATKKKDAL